LCVWCPEAQRSCSPRGSSPCFLLTCPNTHCCCRPSRSMRRRSSTSVLHASAVVSPSSRHVLCCGVQCPPLSSLSALFFALLVSLLLLPHFYKHPLPLSSPPHTLDRLVHRLKLSSRRRSCALRTLSMPPRCEDIARTSVRELADDDVPSSAVRGYGDLGQGSTVAVQGYMLCA
jgi:hypothetical protein